MSDWVYCSVCNTDRFDPHSVRVGDSEVCRDCQSRILERRGRKPQASLPAVTPVVIQSTNFGQTQGQ